MLILLLMAELFLAMTGVYDRHSTPRGKYCDQIPGAPFLLNFLAQCFPVTSLDLLALGMIAIFLLCRT